MLCRGRCIRCGLLHRHIHDSVCSRPSCRSELGNPDLHVRSQTSGAHISADKGHVHSVSLQLHADDDVLGYVDGGLRHSHSFHARVKHHSRFGGEACVDQRCPV
jgi:hypothetical protein